MLAIDNNTSLIITMDQPKIERLLRLMQYLIGNTSYTLDELGKKLDLSRRTMFRYIDTFKSVGFSVPRISEGVYKLVIDDSSKLDISKIVYFTEEEAYVVNNLIDSLDNTNAMKQGLKQKLAAVYDSTSIGNYVGNKENSASIGSLAKAIKNKWTVILKDYSSSHSGMTKDYTVEPFKFNMNYVDFWAYDINDGKNKRFKIARIGHVDCLESSHWKNESFHHYDHMDVFGIHGNDSFHAKIKLSFIAKNLLIEEHPMAADGLSENGSDSWIWEGDVYGIEGIGRFVLGLPKEVVVLEGDKLLSYLQDSARYIIEKVVNGSGLTR